MQILRDPHVAWISAKAAAFAWIGALLFPAIVHLPYGHAMFWICALAGMLVLATVIDGLRARQRGRTSDFVVKSVVPVIILVAASIFSVFAA